MCATCFGRWEAAQRRALTVAHEEDAVALGRASRLAGLHGVTWAVGIILLAGCGGMPAWLSSALILMVFFVAFAMRFRSRRAFQAALILDTAGALVFAATSVVQVHDARLALLLFPPVFSGWLGFLTWRARSIADGGGKRALTGSGTGVR